MLFAVQTLEPGATAVSFSGVQYEVQEPTDQFPAEHIVVPLSFVNSIGRLGHRFRYLGPVDDDAVKLAQTRSIGAPPEVGVPGATVTTSRPQTDPGSVEPGAVHGLPATGLPGDPTAKPPPAAQKPLPVAAAPKPAAPVVEAPGESAPAKK